MAGAGQERAWVLDGSASGLSEVLGVISLTGMDRDQSEIGYWVAPAFWNAGFASEAVRALVAANPLASRTIFAEVFQDNPGSARVLTNCGFEYLGDAETFSVARNARVPTWTYLKKRA
jgi:RimJ/RimL family protein N-acetyltransferase